MGSLASIVSLIMVLARPESGSELVPVPQPSSASSSDDGRSQRPICQRANGLGLQVDESQSYVVGADSTSQPTYQETVDFIAGYTDESLDQTIQIEDCRIKRMVLKNHTKRWKYNDPMQILTWEVDLRKLDPDSAEINDDERTVKIYARNGERAVSFRKEAILWWDDNANERSLSISTWRETPYPEKLCRAMVRLIQLCGGRPEPF